MTYRFLILIGDVRCLDCSPYPCRLCSGVQSRKAGAFRTAVFSAKKFRFCVPVLFQDLTAAYLSGMKVLLVLWLWRYTIFLQRFAPVPERKESSLLVYLLLMERAGNHFKRQQRKHRIFTSLRSAWHLIFCLLSLFLQKSVLMKGRQGEATCRITFEEAILPALWCLGV